MDNEKLDRLAKDYGKQMIEDAEKRIKELEQRCEGLAGALGNIPLTHDEQCELICCEQNPYGRWKCVEECPDRIIREALKLYRDGGGR